MKIKNQSGFTLVEAVIAIALTGVISGMVAVFMLSPIRGYFDTVNRAALADTADTVVRRIDRDLRMSLPNSIRQGAGAQCLEYVGTYTAGRYRAEQDCSGAACTGNILSSAIPTESFDIVSEMPIFPTPGDIIVVYNTGDTGSDVYTGNNTATIANVNSATISFTSAVQFPFESPERRFQVISGSERAVTYSCSDVGIDTQTGDGTGILYKYSNYGFNAEAASTCAAPASGTVSILATNVSTCSLTYDENGAGRFGVVGMQFGVTKNNETVNLYHETAVNNLP